MGSIDNSNKGYKDELGDEITIDGLIEQLYFFTKWKKQKLTLYRITEDFNRVGRHTYNLHNLKAGTTMIGKDEMVMFDDADHTIREDLKRVLMMFPLRNLKSIKHDLECGKNYKALLTFKDGTILIERIKDN